MPNKMTLLMLNGEVMGTVLLKYALLPSFFVTAYSSLHNLFLIFNNFSLLMFFCIFSFSKAMTEQIEQMIVQIETNEKVRTIACFTNIDICSNGE